MMIVADPDCIRHILKDNFKNYIKGHHFTSSMKIFLGEGIFNVNHGLWRQQRKTASHLFKTREIRKMFEIFHQNGNKVMAILDKSATSAETVNISELLSRFTLDSIGEIAFGVQLDSLKPGTLPNFAVAFNEATRLCGELWVSPVFMMTGTGWLSDYLVPEVPIIKKHMAVLDQTVYRIIEERKHAKDIDQRSDLLSGFLNLEKKTGESFSDKYLRDITLNFMLAGRDTISVALGFLFYELARNEAKMKLLQAEVDQVLSQNLPDYDIVKDLPYTKACIDEALRLYPPVPFDPKQAVEDDVLPNGIRVPAGTEVIWSAMAQGRSPHWKNPEKFEPERFLNREKQGLKPIHPYLFVPFQAGPRVCLGKMMAYQEMLSLTSMIAQKFNVHTVPGEQEVTFAGGITLSAAGGIKLQFSHRS
eukprot:CAMPEP_0168532172 /NCGR_PEP_ID=MMETSP0405-20121227/16026_1 /TAXON_ID=498012 /ORGANISM="Trichosphaerium sp, Strain Am-I-7 wt" /LENGTH=417 /DNA_ID=CAMNT_0008557397 /DNA_START=222 /DNA_END=1475 /DNA_ORIENTATION=+